MGDVGLHRPKQVPTNTKWQFASKLQQEHNEQKLQWIVIMYHKPGGEGRSDCVPSSMQQLS